MARLILCTKCKDETATKAAEFKEYFVFVSGAAKKEMMCDTCGTDINEGNLSHACCLLNSSDHFNSSAQNPKRWAGHYIDVN